MKANSKIKRSHHVEFEVSHYFLDDSGNLKHENIYFDSIKEVKQYMKTLPIYDDIYIREINSYYGV